MKAERMETQSTCGFPEALRLVQGGCQVRREGWPPSLLYVSRNRTLDRVELVQEEDDGDGRYCYAVPYLGGAAIGGPPEEDLLAQDWTVVEDPRVPTEDGGERAMAAALEEFEWDEWGER